MGLLLDNREFHGNSDVNVKSDRSLWLMIRLSVKIAEAEWPSESFRI